MAFKKGKNWKGNPNGRPVGSGHRQQLFNTIVEPHKELLIKTAIDLALNGNEIMMRFFLERILPAKAMYQSLVIAGQTADQSIRNIIDYVATGDLTAEDASKLTSIIHKNAEINNQTILIEKITLLEQKINSNQKQDINLITKQLT